MGASPGPQGTARAQLALRNSFVFTETLVLPKPELYVAQAHEKMEQRDGQSRLTDERIRTRIRELLEALATWTARFR